MGKKKLTKREKQKLNKMAIKHWRVTIAIVILVVMFVTLAYFMGWLDKWFKPRVIPSEAGGHSTTMTELKDLEVHFLDIGQGDCIIIELPDDRNMIIDSGDLSDENKDVIENFTRANKIDTFDYMLLTHQDKDHVGNMDWVLENYDVNYIFRPSNYSDDPISSKLPSDFNIKTAAKFSTTEIYAKFMVKAYEEKCKVEIFNKDSDFSNKIIYNENEYSYKFDFLTPIAEREKIDFGDSNNDYSPIMTLEFGGKKVMFTGDAEDKNIKQYVQTYGNANNIDVLKVGHHGSENATTQAFIDAIDPEVAIIQCGQNNQYGHPHSKTLDILGNHEGGVTIYRNDTNGHITLKIPYSSDYSIDLEKDDCSQNYVPGVDPDTLKFGLDYNTYFNNRKCLVA